MSEIIEEVKLLNNKPTEKDVTTAIQTILEYIGEDSNRSTLQDTPARVIKSYKEIYSGYTLKAEDILSKKFQDIDNYNDVVLLKSIEFTSMCEHHMLPFSGKVDIAYISNGAVIGVSKMARLVDMFSKRLQIQERLTAQIANSLQEHLSPLGVAVKISATHSCMSIRGANKKNSFMTTLSFTGEYKEDSVKRAEFLNMVSDR